MSLQRILFIGALFLYPSIIQKSAGQFICTSNDISREDVPTCTCRAPSPGGFCPIQCQVGPSTCGQPLSGVYLAKCDSDCTSPANMDCDSCGLWLSSLCTCLQNPGYCDWQHGKGVPGWVKLAGGYLAIPNQAIRNILALQNQPPSLATTGWDFGQQYSNPSADGLAINPVRSVTQDQVHMHICPFNTDMRNFLTTKSTASIANYKTLQPIQLSQQFMHGNPTTMWCLASQNKNTPISGGSVYDAINSVLQMKNVCNFNVAAAVVRDGNGYTWGCVTGDYGDTEHRFLDCP